MSPPDLVIWLANRKKTGSLKLSRGNDERSVTVENGSAIAATTNDPREFLGQFLVNFGLVTEDQLQRAFEAQKETKVLLGRILVMIGTCNETQVKQTLDRQIREVIHGALEWREGEFEFEQKETIERLPGDLDIAVSLLEMHREGAKRVKHWSAIREAFPNDEASLTVHEERIPPGARPETFDGRILALARAGLTVEGIKLDLHSTDFHFFARLFDLHRKGALEPRETGPIQSFLQTGPLPEGPHADLAKEAFQRADYRRAAQHAAEGMKADPANADLAKISREADAELMATAPAGTSVPKLNRPLDEVLKKRMSAKERYILTRIDGARTIQSIIQISPMRESEGMEIFRRLSDAGVVVF